MGSEFPGSELSWGNFTLGEFARVPKYVPIKLLFLKVALRERLSTRGMGYLRGRFSMKEEISGIILKTIFSNKSALRIFFYLEPSARSFSGEFSARMELSERNIPGGGGVFNVRITFHRGIASGEREFSIEEEPDFPTLFKNDQNLKRKTHVFFN